LLQYLLAFVDYYLILWKS